MILSSQLYHNPLIPLFVSRYDKQNMLVCPHDIYKMNRSVNITINTELEEDQQEQAIVTVDLSLVL